MMRVAVIHGYSADNSGDGLLVRETIQLVREAFGASVDVTLFASYPDSFRGHSGERVRTKPTRSGYDRTYMRHLVRRFDGFDLVVGVGGGYLRSPGGLQDIKTGLVMLPQLGAAALSRTPTIYLAQSIGPLRGPVGWAIRRLVPRIDRVHVRDDRSAGELPFGGLNRSADLAILRLAQDASQDTAVDHVPVMNARTFRGESPPPQVLRLADRFELIDGYIQSTVASNHDGAAVGALNPRRVVSKLELLDGDGPRRVVIAMRLHCALEAIAAGHFVVHLSYERKGFGAFQDLGLARYVHNVSDMSVSTVADQVDRLRSDAMLREEYLAEVRRRSIRNAAERSGIVVQMRELVGSANGN